METDWSVAAGVDDPVIEIPWADAASGLAWVDLRVDTDTQRERIAAIPEAAQSAVLARCLTMLNDLHGLLQTAKGDRWLLNEHERAELADALDVPLAACGYGSYIDVLMAHAVPMADFLLHEEWARLVTLKCAALSAGDARIEIVVRPARNHDTWGYGMTFYCYGSGGNEQSADAVWSRALEQAVPLLIATSESLLPSAGEVDGSLS